MDYILHSLNHEHLWFIFGILLIVFEVFLGFPLVTFFMGIAAITTGAFIAFKFVSEADYTSQAIIFFASNAISVPFVWKYLKGFNKRKESPFQNIVGSQVQVKDTFTKGQEGLVRWSGTYCKAEIDTGSSASKVEAGDFVIVTKIEGNRFIIKPIDKNQINNQYK